MEGLRRFSFVKFVVVVCIFQFCLLGGGFSREKTITSRGAIIYTYESMKEFYEYWNEATSDFSCVAIEFYDYSFYDGYQEPYTQTWVDDCERYFYYPTKNKTLVAVFDDVRHHKKYGYNNPYGRLFYLPKETEQAIEYWNACIKKM